MSEVKKELGKTAGVTAVLGLLITFISIFRSEYLSFLDKITWETYYLSQLLFIVLLVAIGAYLLAKFTFGQLSLRELSEAAQQIKSIPELDEKTRKHRAGELVLFVNSVEDLSVDLGAPLTLEHSKLDTGVIKRDAIRARKSQLFVTVVVLLLVLFVLITLVFFPDQFNIILDRMGNR